MKEQKSGCFMEHYETHSVPLKCNPLGLKSMGQMRDNIIILITISK